MTIKYSVVNGLKQYKIPQKLVAMMFDKAKDISPNTFPIPNKVTASVLTEFGNIYVGAEYRTMIMVLSIHAEAAALSHAATHGEAKIIAITGPNCHACKQMLWENALQSGNDIMILLKSKQQIKQIPLSTMMLYAWPENKWENKQ